MICGTVSFTPYKFLADGEGQTYGHNDPANSWPSQLAQIGTMQTWAVSNIAVNGDIASAISNNYYKNSPPFWPSNTRVPAILWMHAGPTDIEVGQTGQFVYDIIAPALANAAAQGFRVGVTQCWMNPDPAFDAQFQAYNTLIAACPSVTPGLVFNGAATFTTPGSGPNFIPGSYHLTPAGNLIYAQSVYALLRSAGVA